MTGGSTSYRYVGTMSITPVCLIKIDEPYFTEKHLLIQRIRVRYGRIDSIVFIPNKIVPSSNLESRTKPSTKYRMRVVDACVDAGFRDNETCE